MNTEEFGQRYQKSFKTTVRFLISRRLSPDSADETAQAAWAKGWERRAQLREPAMLVTWMNSIALNIYRTALRREPVMEILPDLHGSPRTDSAVIDAEKILGGCKPNDRKVLENHYILGYKVQEIAAKYGWSETAVRIRLLRARRSAERSLTKQNTSAYRKLVSQMREAA